MVLFIFPTTRANICGLRHTNTLPTYNERRRVLYKKRLTGCATHGESLTAFILEELEDAQDDVVDVAEPRRL
jgi:hypothetical protein